MPQPISRRTFLGGAASVAAIAALTACTTAPAYGARILPTDPLVRKTEAGRPSTGRTVTAALLAGPISARISGKEVHTWGYNDSLTAPTIRANVGDTLSASIRNGLADATSVHWHGIALQNAADGVPNLTQAGIKPGATTPYQFRLNAPGTYWYHSHVEMQRERALYGALIVEDPHETLQYDQEWVLILDDWVDGFEGTPDSILKELSQGMSMSGMSGMDMGGTGSAVLMNSKSTYLAGDAGDVKIPIHLINGRSSADPERLTSKVGSKIRLRMINAAGDTAYRVGVPGRQITLTHTDGYPVRHQNTDAVVIGMGERVDALFTVTDSLTQLVALPEGKSGSVIAVIADVSTKSSDVPSAPGRLGNMVTDGGRLRAADSALLKVRKPDRVHNVQLTGSMAKYSWGINGRSFDMSNPFATAFDLKPGERIQVNFTNTTTMWHPMHIHGHTFQIANGGARKDTVIVRPKQRVTVEFDADNPGQWLTHCHNAYHAARGMMGVFSYIK